MIKGFYKESWVKNNQIAVNDLNIKNTCIIYRGIVNDVKTYVNVDTQRILNRLKVLFRYRYEELSL